MINPKGLSNCNSFAEIRAEGFEIFSLGPLYVYVGIDHSLTEQFAITYKNQKKKDVFGTTMRFERQILKGFGDWDYVLELIDKEAFPFLCNWLMSNKFVNRAEGKYFESRLVSAPIADPIMVDSGKVPDDSYLNVFVPSGIHWFLKPMQLGVMHGMPPTTIEFHNTAPEPDVILAGQTALKLMNEA